MRPRRCRLAAPAGRSLTAVTACRNVDASLDLERASQPAVLLLALHLPAKLLGPDFDLFGVEVVLRDVVANEVSLHCHQAAVQLAFKFLSATVTWTRVPGFENKLPQRAERGAANWAGDNFVTGASFRSPEVSVLCRSADVTRPCS